MISNLPWKNKTKEKQKEKEENFTVLTLSSVRRMRFMSLDIS